MLHLCHFKDYVSKSSSNLSNRVAREGAGDPIHIIFIVKLMYLSLSNILQSTKPYGQIESQGRICDDVLRCNSTTNGAN